MNEVLYALEEQYLRQYCKDILSNTKQNIISADIKEMLLPIDPEDSNAVDKIYSQAVDEATIKIIGMMNKDGPGILDILFGYHVTSYRTIQAAIERARNDPAITKVVFKIDSPGGTVDGLDQVWQAHKALAQEKTTEVRVSGMLASAAYWIASPAHAIYAMSPTDEIGSIGILALLYDYSKQHERIGIKEIPITSSNAPQKYPDLTTQEGYTNIQERLNAQERIFYSRISDGRKCDTKHISVHFGKGGLLVAYDPDKNQNDAIKAGMIDGLINHDNKFQVMEKQRLSYRVQMKEGQNMLSELLKTDPTAHAEFEKALNEAQETGIGKAKAEFSAMVERVIPILTSEHYPTNIKGLAGDVLAGRKGIEAFDAAVAVYDAQIEAEKSKMAKIETQKNGSVIAESPDFTTSAEQKELHASIRAAADKRRGKK